MNESVLYLPQAGHMTIYLSSTYPNLVIWPSIYPLPIPIWSYDHLSILYLPQSGHMTICISSTYLKLVTWPSVYPIPINWSSSILQQIMWPRQQPCIIAGCMPHYQLSVVDAKSKNCVIGLSVVTLHNITKLMTWSPVSTNTPISHLHSAHGSTHLLGRRGEVGVGILW